MNWMDNLIQSRYIESAILIDSEGSIIACSDEVEEYMLLLSTMVASASAIGAELARGELQSVHWLTEDAHFFALPVSERCMLLILVNRLAPVKVVLTHAHRLLRGIDDDALTCTAWMPDVWEQIDSGELVQAVEDWLND